MFLLFFLFSFSSYFSFFSFLLFLVLPFLSPYILQLFRQIRVLTHLYFYVSAYGQGSALNVLYNVHGAGNWCLFRYKFKVLLKITSLMPHKEYSTDNLTRHNVHVIRTDWLISCQSLYGTAQTCNFVKVDATRIWTPK